MKCSALMLLLFPLLAGAIEQPRDFAHGLPLAVTAAQPVQEMALPDAVYRGVLRADLGDLRVFNAAGSVVPYALCTAPPASAPARWQARPLYRLERAAPSSAAAALELEVNGADGTRVQLRGAPAATVPAGTGIFGYIIDAGPDPGLVQALRLDGETGERPAELRLRVLGSNDLREWVVLNDAGLLLLAHGDAAALRLDEVPLRPSRQRYLRVVPAGEASLPDFRAASVRVQAAADAVTPRWVPAPRNGPVGRDAGVAFAYDSERLAPASHARISLPAENMALVVALESRARLEDPWERRGQREVHRLRGAPDADNALEFTPRTHRWWRLRVLRGAETLAGAAPALELGYLPAQLRFLTQGEGPWMLAFGSARAAPAGLDCAQLLGGATAVELAPLTGSASSAGAVHEVGGTAALEPPRAPVPLARWLFWVVLVLGVALLLALSLSLLRRMRS